MEKDVAMEKDGINLRELSKEELLRISPLTLAYLGDTIYETYIREYLIKKSIYTKINELHRSAIMYVSAAAQSKAIKSMEEILSEEETTIYKRGRNHKKSTGAKNASIIDYRHSTGFESLIGYLYLKGDTDRLEFIVLMAIQAIENR